MLVSGYAVNTVLHSGHDRGVYWSPDLDEARVYARWIVKRFGKTMGVYVSAEQGKICEWTLADATNFRETNSPSAIEGFCS